MSQAANRLRGMNAPMDYEGMRTIFLWGANSLLVKYGNASPLPAHYSYAAEYLARLLTRLDRIERESPECAITTIGALSMAVRSDMYETYGSPHFDATEVAANAYDGAI